MYLLLLILLYNLETSCSSSKCLKKFAYTLQRKIEKNKDKSETHVRTYLLDDKNSILAVGTYEFYHKIYVTKKQLKTTVSEYNIWYCEADYDLVSYERAHRNTMSPLVGVNCKKKDKSKIRLLFSKACAKYFGDKNDFPISLETGTQTYHFNGVNFPDVFETKRDQQKRRHALPTIRLTSH